ncbi:hypothetical protein QYF36_020443 [Acer negundo]|nr:hypothetical protein QYF36_020443 [Acer negundo]
MARSFVLWLQGLGGSTPANEPIQTLFSSPEFINITKWSFPSAPNNPVTCNLRPVPSTPCVTSSAVEDHENPDGPFLPNNFTITDSQSHSYAHESYLSQGT